MFLKKCMRKFAENAVIFNIVTKDQLQLDVVNDIVFVVAN